ncbi:mitochondrial ribosomal protein S25 [Arctopsyche grandis]|uniref:mitochondrial ribosomal protein S25 n=1 Tax=Arctopsyche grandis TaxID=121162 RepID=UPI00406D888D
MPFMIGPAPVRRTLQYLQSGQLQLLNRIKVFTVNYNSRGTRHWGARQFVFWELPKLQYVNPEVQVATFINMTPSPFIKCYLDDGRSMIVDVDNKTQEQIHDHILTVACKSLTSIQANAEQLVNPANFGVGFDRPCICEVRGQVPCPGIVELPRELRGKYTYQKAE